MPVRTIIHLVGRLAALLVLVWVVVAAASPQIASAQTTGLLQRFLTKVEPGELVPGATSFGAVREDIPVAPVLAGRETVAWAFLTSDFVSTTGYSGKPIHTLVAIDENAVLTGVRLIKHSEPIVLIGIPDKRIRAATEAYAGLDIKAEADSGGEAHDLEIISGATVTIIVIEDSVVRSSIKVARALGLGGLKAETPAGGPRFEVDPDLSADDDWRTLAGDGSLRRLSLDIGQINEAFRASGDEKAAARAEAGGDDETFIDLFAALVSVPTIGRSLLGEAEYANLVADLKPGEHALIIAGRGRYSFKGSGYVRGGLFDRISVIQGDNSIRFRDRQHRRLGRIAAAGAPASAVAEAGAGAAGPLFT